jgi:hypothetical protein
VSARRAFMAIDMLFGIIIIGGITYRITGNGTA